ncbi:DUF4440 domain-containing protein [Altererythrobacter sp. Root672]|uniref:DUF4440 domain-containing protein n=1 Tax=Altererythrobacter sp. Root672 TaxID=1736584 RepID=UPI0006F81522|nr:DUF4440 domain-containing protein [Altererythrobacter sp. Root672]KRA84504.1 hypothetical protein ASD76_11165 [Altererythrobacter sp. Root672]
MRSTGARDHEELKRLNARINDAENRGDRVFLAAVLAPKFAFQRADPERTVDDAGTFLQKVAPGGERTIRVLKPIQLFNDRALVQCIVTQGGRDYHNLRLFVRRDEEWKLLAWANEPH